MSSSERSIFSFEDVSCVLSFVVILKIYVGGGIGKRLKDKAEGVR